MDCCKGICGYTYSYLEHMMNENNTIIITNNDEYYNIYFFPKAHQDYEDLIANIIRGNDKTYELQKNGYCKPITI